ncbi:MAG: YlxR family protein [Anaerolineae bacterium]|nr:YlxR family protein [Anaerolineae bacterium]
MARRRHIPQRTCIICRKVQDKRDLIRIVRTPEGEIVIDPTGKRSGRGAYLCRSQDCWQTLLSTKGRRLEQALKVRLNEETLEMLKAFAASLPPTDSEDNIGAGKETSARGTAP